MYSLISNIFLYGNVGEKFNVEAVEGAAERGE